MFSVDFWDHCVVVITCKIKMDKKAIKDRKRASDGKTDDERAQDYIKVVEQKFEKAREKHLKYLYLDAWYDEEDEDEVAAFNKAMQDLYEMIESHPEGLPTTKVQMVTTEFASVKRELEKRNKEKEEFLKEMEHIKKKSEELEALRHEDKEKSDRETEKLRREFESRYSSRAEGLGIDPGPVVGEVAGKILALPITAPLHAIKSGFEAIGNGVKTLGEGIAGMFT